MELNTAGRQNVTYFVGTEIENTPMKGEKTLFIVGTPAVKEIAQVARIHNVKHLYFGTSQSFQPKSVEDWQRWDTMLTELLTHKWVCTLDFGVEYAEAIHEEGWNEFNNFIPIISVKLPYLKLFNYNATLKIDDKTWGATNTGVWCHPLNSLLQREVYTDWREYVGDESIK